MSLQETLSKLNWGGEGYAAYDGYAYMTGPETSAWNQLGYEVSNMNNWMNLQFKEQQGLLNNFLIPQLESFVTNPPGFGATALSAMRTTMMGNISSQLTSQVRGVQNQFASENLAGLGSGVQEAIVANLKQGASGEEAQGLNQIAIQNAQLQAQQQEYGLSGLSSAEQALGALPQSASIVAGLTGMEQQTSKGFYGQQSPYAGILGSLAGTALNLAIPGAGTALQALGSTFGSSTLGNVGTAMGGWGSYGGYGSGTAPWNTPTPGAIPVATGPAIPGYNPTTGSWPSTLAAPTGPAGVVGTI